MRESEPFVKGQIFAYETVLDWLDADGSETISAKKLASRLAYFIEHLKGEEADGVSGK